MRRIVSVCIVTIIAVCFSGFSVHAHVYGTVHTGIGVGIVLGGTTVIEPEQGAPVPEQTEMTLKDGETGVFTLAFSSVGIYHYSVRVVPDERKLEFDDTVYKVTVYVNDVNGVLEPTIIISKDAYKYGDDPDRLWFVNKVPGGVEPSPTPKTNDTSEIPVGWLYALLASAGMLLFSHRLIAAHKRNT